MVLKLGMKDQGGALQSSLPRDDLDLFYSKVNIASHHESEWGKLSKCHLKGKLKGNGQMD